MADLNGQKEFPLVWLDSAWEIQYGEELRHLEPKVKLLLWFQKDPIDLIQTSHQNAFWMPLEVFQARQTEKNLVYLEPRRDTGAGQKLTGGIMYLI